MILEGLNKQLLIEANKPAGPTLWRRRGRLAVRASSLGDCPRALWYNLNGAVASPVSIDIVRAWMEGREFEKRLIKLLKEAGYDIRDKQKTLTKIVEGVYLKGHIDAMLYVMDEPATVVEAKRERMGSTNMILDRHLIQANAYSELTGVPVTLIVDLKASHFDSHREWPEWNSRHLREIHIPPNPELIARRMRQVARIEKEEPPRLRTTPLKAVRDLVQHSWRCMYCRYSEECLPNAKVIEVSHAKKLVSER